MIRKTVITSSSATMIAIRCHSGKAYGDCAAPIVRSDWSAKTPLTTLINQDV
jgi:hypothetical protein